MEVDDVNKKHDGGMSDQTHGAGVSNMHSNMHLVDVDNSGNSESQGQMQSSSIRSSSSSSSSINDISGDISNYSSSGNSGNTSNSSNKSSSSGSMNEGAAASDVYFHAHMSPPSNYNNNNSSSNINISSNSSSININSNSNSNSSSNKTSHNSSNNNTNSDNFNSSNPSSASGPKSSNPGGHAIKGNLFMKHLQIRQPDVQLQHLNSLTLWQTLMAEVHSINPGQENFETHHEYSPMAVQDFVRQQMPGIKISDEATLVLTRALEAFVLDLSFRASALRSEPVDKLKVSDFQAIIDQSDAFDFLTEISDLPSDL